MIRRLLISCLLGLPTMVFAQVDTKLTPGAALLFKNVKTKASISDKNRLFELLELKVARDQMGFTMEEYTVDAVVFPTDMNKDGKEELFVGLASAALFGNAGESFSLYMKEKSGRYTKIENLGLGRPAILKTSNLGYPDVMMGGPGFSFPVYRWNGRGYALHRRIKDADLNNSNWSDIEEYSKTYTSRK